MQDPSLGEHCQTIQRSRETSGIACVVGKANTSHAVWCFSLAQRAETRAQFVAKGLWLLPRREMRALGQAVVVDEVRVGFLRPALRRGVDLVRKDAHCRWNRDTFGHEESEFALPVQPRRGD